jgi:hypothetical protein
MRAMTVRQSGLPKACNLRNAQSVKTTLTQGFWRDNEAVFDKLKKFWLVDISCRKPSPPRAELRAAKCLLPL